MRCLLLRRALRGVPPQVWTTRAFRSIPVIDISALTRDGCPKEQRLVARDLHNACRDVGFFYVSGHGMDESVRRGVLDYGREFFRQPPHFKREISISSSAPRGYQRCGENVTKGVRDMHEAIDFMREFPPQHALAGSARLDGRNRWPREAEGGTLVGFRTLLERYTEECCRLGRCVMRGLAMGLELPPGYFDAAYSEAFWVMRVIGYPPSPTATGGGEDVASDASLGCGEHTDYGCLTIVNADDVRGALQARNTRGEWVAADPVQGAFLMNIGDMLSLWTNGLFQSTPHRVLRPPEARVSVPFFFEPNYDTAVSPIPSCVAATGGKPITTKPMIYGEHLEGKVFSNFAVIQ